MCIDDEWYQARSAELANTAKSSQDISVTIADSTSVTIKWSECQSILSNDKNISGYDLSCTTSSLSGGWNLISFYEVRVSNISTSTSEIQVNGLLPGTAYECCVNAHIQTNTPLDLITTSCVAISTKSEKLPSCGDGLAAGLGTGLGLLLVVVCMGSLFVNVFLIKRLIKRDHGTKVTFSSTNQ